MTPPLVLMLSAAHPPDDIRVVRKEGAALAAAGWRVRHLAPGGGAPAPAAVAGVAGGIHAMYVSYVTVGETFSITVPLYVVLMSVLGGARHWLGPAVGATIIAASLYAFEHHQERLAEDHQRARTLAQKLREVGYEVATPETNLVLVEVDEPEEFLEALAREGVLATPGKPGYVRLCTHLDVGEAEIEAAVEAAARITTLQR